MKRKLLAIFSVTLVLLGGMYVFKQNLTVASARFFLKQTLGHRFACEEIVSSDSRITLKGLSLMEERMQVRVDTVSFSIDLKECLLHPKNLLQLAKTPSSHWSSYLAALKQYGISLDMRDGILTLDDKRYYFGFASGEKKHEIGTLQIYLDPELELHPFLVAQFHMRGDQLISQMKIDEVQSERFFHLGSFAFPQHLSGYKGAEGAIQMHASVIFEKDGQIDEISTRFKTSQFGVILPRAQLAVGAESLSGELSYPEGLDDRSLPMWKRMECNLQLQNGTMQLGENFFLKDLTGSLGLDPREDPSMQLLGTLKSGEKFLAMELKGKGAIADDHAYWLEFDLNLDDHKGTPCDAFLSICSPETNSHVLQIEATGLLPEQVDMLKNYFSQAMPRLSDWRVQGGVFGGKLVALFEEGRLSRFEVQDIACEKVELVKGQTPFYFSKIQAEGTLFDQLAVHLTMPTAHFFGLVSQPLRESYEEYLPEDYLHLSSTLQFSEKGVETSASVEFPNVKEAIHFGFTAPVAFIGSLEEIEKGWARSEKISHKLYGPFVRKAHEDLKVYGAIDLVGTYDGNEMDLALQVEDFLVKHPRLDLKAERVGKKGEASGRIRLCYDIKQKSFRGTLPLDDASAYERELGIVFEKLKGSLTFTRDQIEGSLENGSASFDGNLLLTDLFGNFKMQDTFFLEGIKGKLPFATDREFFIAIDEATEDRATLRLLDGKDPCALVQLTKEDSWKGEAKCAPLDLNCKVDFSWDRVTNDCQLALVGEELNCLMKKEGSNYWIESLKHKDLTLTAAFSKQAEGFALSQIAWMKNDLRVAGSGLFSIEIPQKQTPLTLTSKLDLVGEYQGVKFATTQPIGWGCSPMLGWVLSEGSIAHEDSLVSFDHIEHHFSSGSTSIHGGQLALSESFCQKLIDASLLPQIAADFHLDQGIKAVAHGTVERGHLQFAGQLQTRLGPFDAKLDWKERAGTFSLGGEESLDFTLHLDEEGALQFDAIKGSLGRIQAHLEKVGKETLKGSLSVDFSLFHEILDLPLNQYLKIWKTGGGYSFNGTFTPAPHFADWGFKGKLVGRDFSCCGYTLKKLEAKMEMGSGQIAIEDLDVRDDAGKAWISEGAIMRSGGDWVFSFPLVEVRSFQPSFLRKMEGGEKPIDPIVIKSATLNDVRGKIDDPKSLTASGRLTFTNLSKKGESKFPKNLPIPVLRSMGLEGNLFVPTSGQMEYQIQGGRCYLRGIQNVISANGRSEFNPPRNGVMGYVDFDGSVFIDMQVRQNVVRSISGPLYMQVRGNLDDPEITIK